MKTLCILALLLPGIVIAQTTVTGTLTINNVKVPFTGTIPTPPAGPQGPPGAQGPAGQQGPPGTCSCGGSSSGSSSSSSSSGGSSSSSGGSGGGGTPPAYVVYSNGTFAWASTGGTFAGGTTVNYTDTAGAAPGGAQDMAVKVTQTYGIWLPYINNYCNNTAVNLCFAVSPYTNFVFQVKPTVANQTFQMSFAYATDSSEVDTQDGVWVTNVASYCTPALTSGVWSQCTIPLSAFGFNGPLVNGVRYERKFSIQDETGLASNLFYLENVGLQ
jgi:hypothetical protein